MTDQIIDKKHPYWRAVYVRLNDGLINYDCNHTVEITKRILTSLPNQQFPLNVRLAGIVSTRMFI